MKQLSNTEDELKKKMLIKKAHHNYISLKLRAFFYFRANSSRLSLDFRTGGSRFTHSPLTFTHMKKSKQNRVMACTSSS